MNSFWRWSPPAAVMAAIFFFSSRTGDQLNTLLPFFREFVPSMEGFDWGHFIAYFILSLTFLWALTDKLPGWKTGAAAVLLCLLYGMTDEYHQLFVPGRMCDWHDLRNDGIGALLAVLSLRLPVVGRLFLRLPHSVKGRA